MNIAEKQQELRAALEKRGVQDPRVLDAVSQTRRDLFVPDNIRERAYEDRAFPIGSGQTISQPYIVALMTEALKLEGHERVLEIGTGSGYQSAILARLCQEVVTVERFEDLSRRAQEILIRLGYTNIEFRLGDGTLGCPEQAPYEGIVVTAFAPQIPQTLIDQLKPGGRMVIPVGSEAMQELLFYEKLEPEPVARHLCDCRFVKLVGREGWPEEGEI